MSLSTLLPARFGRPLIVALGLVAGIALAPAAHSAPLQASRADQVFVRHPRRAGEVEAFSGKVKTNSLSEVVLETDGSEQTFPSDRVLRVQLNDVSDWMREGRALYARGDYAAAASSFQSAATDLSLSAVERAAARLGAARSLLRRGQEDASYYTEAANEAARVVTDFSESREVPAARMLQARATHLGGDATGARDLYKAIYEEVAGGTPKDGYTLADGYRAAQLAGYAALDGDDTLGAREIFGRIGGELDGVIAGVEPEDPARAELELALSNATLGEGHALLASGKFSEARSFFNAQLAKAEADGPAALRFGALEGLGHAHKGAGDLIAAQLEFAKVVALDYTDPDRSARALFALAECLLAGGSSDAKEQALSRLTTIKERYGNTPTASQAAELAATL